MVLPLLVLGLGSLMSMSWDKIGTPHFTLVIEDSSLLLLNPQSYRCLHVDVVGKLSLIMRARKNMDMSLNKSIEIVHAL